MGERDKSLVFKRSGYFDNASYDGVGTADIGFPPMNVYGVDASDRSGASSRRPTTDRTNDGRNASPLNRCGVFDPRSADNSPYHTRSWSFIRPIASGSSRDVS